MSLQQTTFTLPSPVLHFQFPSFIPSLGAEHLLGSLLLCPISRELHGTSYSSFVPLHILLCQPTKVKRNIFTWEPTSQKTGESDRHFPTLLSSPHFQFPSLIPSPESPQVDQYILQTCIEASHFTNKYYIYKIITCQLKYFLKFQKTEILITLI